tara:strand:+ start:52 stop:432 length:381 start_codon:yes stop_codon:yes gene_type:complete
MKNTQLGKSKSAKKTFDYGIISGVIYGLILGTTFSIIDNLLFLIAEQHMTSFLERSIHNRNIIGLIEGSVSAAFAFLIASYFEKKLHSMYPKAVMKHASIDFIGILLGGFLVAFIYYIITLRNSDT